MSVCFFVEIIHELSRVGEWNSSFMKDERGLVRAFFWCFIKRKIIGLVFRRFCLWYTYIMNLSIMDDKIKIRYTYCLDYINSKQDKFCLTLEDLLYLSNFKWWSWNIQEPLASLKDKLKYFSDKFITIDKFFKEKSLYQLSVDELQKLIAMCNGMLLDSLNSEYKIAWIWPSYMSALLHLYFQNLCPIIDRNILLWLSIIWEDSINKQWQVKEIHSFYDTLTRKIYLLQKVDSTKKIKDIDDEYFQKGQEEWEKIKQKRKDPMERFF